MFAPLQVCVCVVGMQVNVRVCVCVNGTSKGDSRLWSIQVCCPEIALCCCLYPLISSASPTVKWVHTHSGTHKAPPPPLPAPHSPTPLLQLLPSAWNRWQLFFLLNKHFEMNTLIDTQFLYSARSPFKIWPPTLSMVQQSITFLLLVNLKVERRKRIVI